jgi:hypothetical protein
LPTRIELAGFVPRKAKAHAVVLMGDWAEINTPEHPERVKPSESDWHLEFREGAATRTFPPNSFTVLRFE